MTIQLMIHDEKRLEVRLGLVRNIFSTGLITAERDGDIGIQSAWSIA